MLNLFHRIPHKRIGQEFSLFHCQDLKLEDVTA
jgi:hypothetical protein